MGKKKKIILLHFLPETCYSDRLLLQWYKLIVAYAEQN